MAKPLAQLVGGTLMALVVLASVLLLRRMASAKKSLDLTWLRRIISSPIGATALLYMQDASTETVEEVFKCLGSRRMNCAKVTLSSLWLITLGFSAQLGMRLLFVSDEEIFNGLALSVLLVLLTLPQVFPRVFFKSIVFAFAHVFIMAVLCAMALDDNDQEMALAHHNARFIGALCCGGLYLWSPLILFTSSVFMMCSVVSKLRLFEASPNLFIIILLDILSGMSLIALFSCLELIALYNAKKEVEQRSGKCELSAVSSLLEMMCDALVHLDADMVMEEHSPRLAAMLMHGAGQSLKGKAFSTLIPVGEDTVRFDAIARTCRAATGGLPEPSLNLWRLRDAIGNHVPVTVFHVPYSSIGGQVHHIMGIREDSGGGGSGFGSGSYEFPDGVHRDANACGPRVPAATLRPDLAKVLGRSDSTDAEPEAQNEPPPMTRRSGGAGGGGLMSGSSSQNSSNGFGSLCAETPDPRMAVNIFLESMLPVHAVAPRLQRLLNLEAEEVPRLGKLMPDNGERLLSRALDIIDDTTRNSGPGSYFRDLGEFEIRSKQNNGFEEVSSRRFWIDFAVPSSDERTENDSTMSDDAAAAEAVKFESSSPGAATIVIGRGPRRGPHGRQQLRGTSADASNARESIEGCGGGGSTDGESRRAGLLSSLSL